MRSVRPQVQLGKNLLRSENIIMDKVGFIGHGHMGSVMLNSLLSAKAIQPEQVVISTRTKTKLDGLKARYPAVEIAANNQEVAEKSLRLFVCVGTFQVKDVLAEIRDVFSVDHHLGIISGGLEIVSVERMFEGAVSKVMPTIISEVHQGVTLVCSNSKVKKVERDWLCEIFGKIGQVKTIQEHQFEIGADFTSCMPGLFAAMCDQFIKAGVRKGDLTYEEASEMLLYTLGGTIELLRQKGESFKGLIHRVATKGGATEGGVAVLETRLPEVFEEVLSVTLQRHEARMEKTRQQFEEA
jgi:pyrroline-5-carboxylate reductase